MARVKLSPIISSIKGKLGNSVFQGGKSGIILREKVIPRNRRTQLQIQKRALLQATKSEWQELTTTQKDSWTALANFMKQKQKNDATKVLTPYELFIQSNFTRNQADIPTIQQTPLETATIVAYYQEVSNLTPTKFEMYLETRAQGTKTYSSLYLSRPFRQSAAISRSEVRYIDTIYDSYGDLDITAKYLSLFGTLPISGQKLLLKRVSFLPDSGWISKVYFEEFIIE